MHGLLSTKHYLLSRTARSLAAIANSNRRKIHCHNFKQQRELTS